MPTFQYQIQQHSPNEGEIFRTGQSNAQKWIALGIGATTKEPELLNRLEQWLNATSNPTAEGFKQILNEYLDWYRQRYYEAKGKECTLSDEGIVKSAGVVVANSTGQLTTISVGDCQFCRLTAPHWQLTVIAQGWQQVMLSPNDLLVIDPKRADMAMGIKQALKTKKPDALTFDSPYPVAVCRAVAQSPTPIDDIDIIKPKRSYVLLSVLLLAMAGLLGGGYFYHEINGLWPVSADSTATTPVDSLTEMPTDTQQVVVVVPPSDTLADNPPPPTPTDSSMNNEIPSNDEKDKAQHFLSQANRAFNLAKAKEADGYGQEAIKLYKKAKGFYEDYLNLEPGQKKVIRQQLDFIDRKIQLLGNEASF